MTVIILHVSGFEYFDIPYFELTNKINNKVSHYERSDDNDHVITLTIVVIVVVIKQFNLW